MEPTQLESENKEILESITMYPVMSSNISAIGYNSDKRILRVIFKGGSSYIYFNVEPETYNLIANSESKGKTLNECIVRQKEKYTYRKI